MTEKRDYYEILGIERGATAQEIKTAYRRLARKHHPDVSKHDGAEEAFKEINEAYEVLKDDDKRMRYDRFGHDTGQAGMGGGDFTGDISFGDIFDMFFGGGPRGPRMNPQAPERGSDLRFDLELSLEEAAYGIDKTVEIPRMTPCDACAGTGAKPGTSRETCSLCKGAGQVRQSQNTILGSFSTITTCPRCHGDGQILRDPCIACGGQGRTRKGHKLTIQIPPGVDNGSRLRLGGEGDAGQRGGRAGDLHVVINVRPHEFFERRGRDLFCQVAVSFTQAALGDRIQVPTLQGSEELIIPAGTQAGASFRLREKGMPQIGGRARGDEHVVIAVVTPTNLNERQRELLLQFAEASGEKIQPESEKGFLEKMKEALGGKSTPES